MTVSPMATGEPSASSSARSSAGESSPLVEGFIHALGPGAACSNSAEACRHRAGATMFARRRATVARTARAAGPNIAGSHAYNM